MNPFELLKNAKSMQEQVSKIQAELAEVRAREREIAALAPRRIEAR